MRHLILFSFFLFLIIQVGCKQSTELISSDMYVNFEVESSFQNDFVKVTLDDDILLESRITTDYTISLAWSSGLKKLSRDNHVLHFNVVEYGVQKYYNIDTKNDTSTVLLRFDKNTNQITIKQIEGILLRD